MRDWGRLLVCGRLLLLSTLVTAKLGLAMDCGNSLDRASGSEQNRPVIAADSRWRSYYDTVNGFSFQVQIYKNYESKNLDHYGAVVIAFPRTTAPEALDPAPANARLTREFLISKIIPTAHGFRMKLLESPRRRAKTAPPPPLERWIDRWIEGAKNQIELEVTVMSDKVNLRAVRKVAAFRLKWDRHPWWPYYHSKVDFYRGLVDQDGLGE